METIIQQITIKLVEQVLEDLRENGIGCVGEAAQRLLGLVKPAVLEIIVEAIRQMDLSLVAANKERRADGLRVKERGVPRTVLTDLGVLRYERTYFETRQGLKCYLTDHLIGVEPYGRLTKELCAALVQQAADKSMEKAAKDAGVDVSRQTVNNKVLALREVSAEAVRADETPRELHVFADEDHVHMKNGRSAIVPLITVAEGIDVSQKRHKTINAIHFEGYGINNQSFFESISSFLGEAYDMEQVEHVYVHAGGGQWIRTAADWLPNVTFIMDGFHLEKRLRQMSRLSGAACYMAAIRKSIKENHFEQFASYCTSILEKLDEHGRKTLTDIVSFFQNHWDSIVMRMQKEVCGSCTEPLVSHILSARLSRNPLAWSEHGLRQMAMLRVYTKNGGVVEAKDIRISRKRADLDCDRKSLENGFAKYRSYADKQIDEFLQRKPDWSIFNHPRFRSGKVDGSYMLKKAFGKLSAPSAYA